MNQSRMLLPDLDTGRPGPGFTRLVSYSEYT